MEANIDKYGRIIIPKKVRDDLGLRTGDTVSVEEGNEIIILKPLRGEPHLMVKDGVLVYSGTALEDISNAVETHRKERIKKLTPKI